MHSSGLEKRWSSSKPKEKVNAEVYRVLFIKKVNVVVFQFRWSNVLIPSITNIFEDFSNFKGRLYQKAPFMMKTSRPQPQGNAVVFANAVPARNNRVHKIAEVVLRESIQPLLVYCFKHYLSNVGNYCLST